MYSPIFIFETTLYLYLISNHHCCWILFYWFWWIL